jgi:signal transduction histidine kinase
MMGLCLCLLLLGIALPDAWGQSVPPAALTVRLDAEEKAWLAQHPVLRVGGPRAFPPFSFFDQEDRAQGMAFDYLRLIFEAAGLEMRVKPGLPWPQVLDKAKARQLDVIACAAWTEEREDYLLFSTPFLSFPLVIISRKDAPFIGGLGDLHGRTVAIVKDNVTQQWLERDDIAVVPHLVGTPLEALQAVSLGQADAYIENLAAATWLIDKHGLANLKVAAPTTYGNYELHLAVRNDWPELVAILDKALTSFTPEQHAAIRNKWLTLRYEYGLRPADVWKWVLVVLLPALLALAVILYWNRRLRREVARRQQAESFLQDIIDKNPLSIQVVDKEGRTLQVNAALFRLFGATPPPDYSVFNDPLARRQGLQPFFERARAGEVVYVPEMTYNTHKLRSELADKEVWIRVVIFPLLGSSGRPERYVLMHEDITDRKRAEDALRQAKDDLELRVAERTRELHEANLQLQQLDELKSAFISLVSHELRTPLTSILGFAKLTGKSVSKHFLPLAGEDAALLKRAALVLDNLKVIESEGARLARLINQLLDINKIESGKSEWHDTELDLAEEARAAVATLQAELSESPDILVELDIDPATPPVVADRDRIRQVFLNLLSNALKFTTSGFIRIAVAPLPQGGGVETRVQDSGVGIPESELEHVFDQFHQVSSPGLEDGQTRGTGLGLAICRQIVEYYGGKIWAESTLGQGATFIFTLPPRGRGSSGAATDIQKEPGENS